MVFDAVAIILSTAGAAALATEAAAIDFVRDAFGHLKAIGVDAGGQKLFDEAGLERDDAVVEIDQTARFITAAKGRLWTREPSVRTLP